MLNHQDQDVTATNNPLFYRDKQGEIVFISYNDLTKFSIKFKNFKDNYHTNK